MFWAMLHGAAAAQSSPPSARGGLITPGSRSVEGRVAAVRDAVEAGRYADAEALVARLPARVRNRDDVAWLSIRARHAMLNVPVEPGGIRALSAGAQADAAALARRVARYTQEHPDSAVAWLVRAHLEIAEGTLELALSSLDAYTRLRAADPVGANDRAMVLVALRRLREAEDALVTATQLGPRDAEPWDNLGAVRLARGEGESAVLAFERAVENARSSARYHSDLGSAYLATGHAERAVASYRHAADLAPTDGVILSNLGYALSVANRVDEALSALRHAVDVAPRSVGAWYNLGTVLARRGDNSGAADAFRHALAIDPNDSRSRAALDTLDH
jgi:Flp pilus assembly protein TadD